MPQGHENKGKKNKKTRVTYRVKRPPKWEGAPPYGANFARESNPAFRLVKILHKDYIQYKRAIDEGSSEKGDTHTQAKPSQNPRKTQ